MKDNRSQAMRDIDDRLRDRYPNQPEFRTPEEDAGLFSLMLLNAAIIVVAMVIVGGGLWAFLNFIGRVSS